jgi:hypothetical protein
LTNFVRRSYLRSAAEEPDRGLIIRCAPYTLSPLRGYKEQKAKTTLKIVRRKIKWIS